MEDDVKDPMPDVRRSAKGDEEREERSTKREELKRKHGTSRNCSDRESLERSKNECEFREISASDRSADVAKTPTRVTFEGFKKRILSETRDNRDSTLQPANNRPVVKKKRRDKRGGSSSNEPKRGKITEYAQYLGLQPASNKTSCANCRETTNSWDSSILDQQPCTCPLGMTQSAIPSTPGTSDSCTNAESPTSAASTANNFRITRKVYLCAACGTYFENWNLFLHMREIHKRHICLFCLGMFGQAERLSFHLAKKHKVIETTFTSVGDFYDVYKGSCYLICCTCEKLFAETDNFYNHFCSPVHKGRRGAVTTSDACSVCRRTVNGHSTSCSHVEARESRRNHGLPGIPGMNAETASSRGVVDKRIRKNKRLKRNVASALTSYQQKMATLYARKNFKPRDENAGYSADNVSVTSALRSHEIAATSETTPIATNATTIIPKVALSVDSRHVPEVTDTPCTIRDTVSETIMQVSKCTDDSFANNTNEFFTDHEIESSAVKVALSPRLSSSFVLSSPVRQLDTLACCRDSVTETIMEVSRCCDELDTSENEINATNDRFDENETSSRDSDVDALVMDDACSSPDDNNEISLNVAQRSEERLNSATNPACNDQRRDKRRMSHGRNENDIRYSDSEVNSECSVNVARDGNLSRSSTSPEKETLTTSAISFTTVNSTDRGLVIKICTNRNARLSVARSIGGNTDNRENSRESEENNNAEVSTSNDKASNRSEPGDRENFNSCHVDEDVRSDAKDVKLPHVDVDDKTIEEITKVSNETTREAESDIRLDDEASSRDNTVNCPEAKIPSEEVGRGEEAKKYVTTGIVGVTISEESDDIVLASEDVPSTDLTIDGILESMNIEDLLRRCVSVASTFCVYCNHARNIAVNGKQLGLHVLAEHRFQPQHSAIIIQPEQFVVTLKKSLDAISTSFFNLDSYENARGTFHVPTPRVFECFHCRYHSHAHKDIYLHNRKMHQKTILICIMCKSTFYSYSELLCHLCPGVYSPNASVTYRCCLCPVTNLPSAFRLMVHLRKRHHTCDVCLESTGNQQRLSNHVWKHKLHHLCYRCGIAYRNKPDITKHLFWKHGTESVLCKKCLQKKWPHVYHFCIPPTTFVCEECACTFTRAVALKVHKRLHTGDRPYGCNECDEIFISRKLAARHETRHREPKTIEPEVTAREVQTLTRQEDNDFSEKFATDDTAIVETTMTTAATTMADITATTDAHEANKRVAVRSCVTKESKEPIKRVVDVYDLPPLNLSSDSDTDVDEAPIVAPKDLTDAHSAPEVLPKISIGSIDVIPETTAIGRRDPCDGVMEVEPNEDENNEEAQIMDDIWDNFKTYAASLEQRENTNDLGDTKCERFNREYLCKVILDDHDYCVVYTEKSVNEEAKNGESTRIEENCATMENEHDYGHKVTKSPSNGSVILNCDSDTNASPIKRKRDKTPKMKIGATSSSDSSSDSDSSSCSCGTNCSCSTSSSGSSSSTSSSSDSESSASESSSPRKQQTVRKERRRDKSKEASTGPEVPLGTSANATRPETPIEIIEEPVIVREVNERKETRERNIAEAKNDVNARPPSPQLILGESDLDTDETETDEDFYDEHPQQLANRLLAEKRNQLMLLAAVAPASTEPVDLKAAPENVNNGTLENPSVDGNSLEGPDSRNVTGELLHVATTATTASTVTTRKRVKTKKRKRSDRGRSNRSIDTTNPTLTVESIKLNIPKSFYDNKTTKFGTKEPLVTLVPCRSSTPSIMNSSHYEGGRRKYTNDACKATSLGGSGSENDNKRSSKRKRVPKRFYGDSSDEEAQQHTDHHRHRHRHRRHQQEPLAQQQQHYDQTSLEWRNIEPPILSSASVKNPSTVLPSTNASYATKSVTLRLPGFDRPMERIVPIVTGPSESEEQAESSSPESSENEDTNVLQVPEQTKEMEQPQQPPESQQSRDFAPTILPVALHHGPNTTRIGGINPPIGRSENLYCYCQCPYDEVSDMIACDGNDCNIEWFHFECVGIMVPPKGKWYCPECRKRDSTLVNDDFRG